MKCNNAIRVSSLLGLVSDMKPKIIETTLGTGDSGNKRQG